MSQFLLDHLSATLSENNIIAYIWNVEDDSFTWAGDLQGFLGLEKQDYPSDNAALHKMLNPQDVPERLTALHDMLGSNPDHDIPSSFKAQYKMRRVNGSFVDIDETATLQRDEKTGDQLVCGFLKKQEVKAAPQVDGHADGHDHALNLKSGLITDNVVEAAPDSGYTSYGRRLMMQKVEEWLDTHDESQKSFGYLLTVGIDRMALFNEVMGPRYADEILEKTGQRLRQIVGESGYVTRVDGDVFSLLFQKAPHNEMAAVAKYILNNFYNVPLQSSMGPIGVGISIGGVTLDKVKLAPEALTMAEMAMHVAKDKGRSCFVSYDEASHKAQDNKLLLQSADTFLRAMKSNRLRLAFQPIMDSRKNSVSFHECLMRLIDDDGQMISAGTFVPAIEQLGLSRLVDQYALRMAIQELSMFPDVHLSVNVSNLSLNNQDWLRSIVAALRDRPSVAQRLIVEITESAVIADPENTKGIVRTLQDLGCRVALDDFGAGYTAFSQLKDLKVDLVKIDKHFIRNINEEHNHLFVRTLKSLAEGVNVQTVGEGAETMAEAELLTNDGIDHIQGYIFGFPRVERVWLPKDHVHRQISLEGLSVDHQGVFSEETAQDIASWKRKGQ